MTRSFDVFFELRLNKRLSKRSWGWWFETPSSSLWRHCNVRFGLYQYVVPPCIRTLRQLIISTAVWSRESGYYYDYIALQCDAHRLSALRMGSWWQAKQISLFILHISLNLISHHMFLNISPFSPCLIGKHGQLPSFIRVRSTSSKHPDIKHRRHSMNYISLHCEVNASRRSLESSNILLIQILIYMNVGTIFGNSLLNKFVCKFGRIENSFFIITSVVVVTIDTYNYFVCFTFVSKF